MGMEGILSLTIKEIMDAQEIIDRLDPDKFYCKRWQLFLRFLTFSDIMYVTDPKRFNPRCLFIQIEYPSTPPYNDGCLRCFYTVNKDELS